MTAIASSSPGLSTAYQAAALQSRQQDVRQQPPPPPVEPVAPGGAASGSPGPGLGRNVDIRA